VSVTCAQRKETLEFVNLIRKTITGFPAAIKGEEQICRSSRDKKNQENVVVEGDQAVRLGPVKTWSRGTTGTKLNS